MTWVKLDDHFDEHPKIQAVGPLGIALWTVGIAYCNRNMTDGFIPWSAARKLLSWEFLGPEDEKGRPVYQVAVSCGMAGDDVTCAFVIDLLLEAGLWEEVDGGYLIHDYLDFQPSKADLEAQREKLHETRSQAGRAGAAARWRDSKHGKPMANDMATASQTDGPVPVPDISSSSRTGERKIGYNPPPPSQATALWTDATGDTGPMGTAMIVKFIDEAESHRRGLPAGAPGADVDGDTWVCEAIREANASKTQARINGKFVGVVLDRWYAEGYKAPFRRNGRVAGASHVDENLAMIDAMFGGTHESSARAVSSRVS